MFHLKQQSYKMRKIPIEDFRRQLIMGRPFIIYNLQNMDSFIVLNITENKKYILYNHAKTNERVLYKI
jgi:hypothetical protein